MRPALIVSFVALLSGGATGCSSACAPESFDLIVDGHARGAATVTASGPCRVLRVCDADSETQIHVR